MNFPLALEQWGWETPTKALKVSLQATGGSLPAEDFYKHLPPATVQPAVLSHYDTSHL